MGAERSGALCSYTEPRLGRLRPEESCRGKASAALFPNPT